MTRNDDITPDRLLADLRYFSRFLQRMEDDGRLLEATPRIMRMMGDLRSKLFEYEVRCTRRLAPPRSDPDASGSAGGSGAGRSARDRESPEARASRRIVEEAVQRARDAEAEWLGTRNADEEGS